MYAFTSSGSRRWLHALVICAIAGAILLFSVSGADGVPFAWVIQLLAVLFATVGVYLLVRYSLREYRYEITDSGLADAEGQPVLELSVTMVTGRRMQVLMRVALREIGQVQVLDRAAWRAQRKTLRGAAHLYRYDNDPFASSLCCIVLPGEDSPSGGSYAGEEAGAAGGLTVSPEDTVVLIPPDPGMVEILSGAAGQNRFGHP